MIEFTIIFSYDNKEQKAGVMKSANDNVVEYDVRPAEPETVKRFGKQISIYREAENFNTGNHIDEDYIGFFNVLVAAIKEQDQEEASFPQR
jgi:hypothetical protein